MDQNIFHLGIHVSHFCHGYSPHVIDVDRFSDDGFSYSDKIVRYVAGSIRNKYTRNLIVAELFK